MTVAINHRFESRLSSDTYWRKLQLIKEAQKIDRATEEQKSRHTGFNNARLQNMK